MMPPATADSLVMLLVEDNAADVVFLKEAIDAARTPARLHVVNDGEAAMRFLRRQKPHADAPRPNVVVLDLNLPLRSGREVLADMAADPTLSTIPVAILTTSPSEAWLCGLYPSGRCTCFSKTDNLGELREIVGKIARHAKQQG